MIKKASSSQEESFEEFKTRRPIAPGLEDVLYRAIPVLDHGFIRVVDYMGNDSSIVQAARVSYGAGTKRVSEDKGLINYLMRHRHTTPFEMCELKVHVKVPIFVARQWIRHRTASINEYSARYSLMKDEFYLPSFDYLAPQSTINNQGRMGEISHQEKLEILKILKEDAERGYQNYEKLMNITKENHIIDSDKSGLARELARMNLGVNFYTEFYWKINLHNLFHFLSLRADSHAQLEIRDYARVLLDLTALWVPFAHEAFIDYRYEASYVSQKEKKILKKLMIGEKVNRESSALSAREWGEFVNKFELENLVEK